MMKKMVLGWILCFLCMLSMDSFVYGESGDDIISLDTIPPVITAFSQIPSESVNGYCKEVQLKVEARDNIGLYSEAYSWDGGSTWTTESVKKVNENGTYDVIVRDTCFNTAEGTIEVTTIDREPPICTGIQYVLQNETNKFGKSARIVVEAHDSGCGLDDNAYSFDGGASWQCESQKEITQNGTVSIQIRDHFSNTTSQSVTITNIDHEGPIISEVSMNPINGEGDYGKSVRIQVKASDAGVGLAPQAYSFDGGKSWSSPGTYVVNQCGVVTISVRDSLGNETKQRVEVDKVDMDAPTIQVSGNPMSQVVNGATLIITANDRKSGMRSLSYQKEGERKIVLGEYSGVPSITEQVRITRNGNYHFFACDRLGNTTEETVYVSKIAPAAKKHESSGSSSTRQILLPEKTGGPIAGQSSSSYTSDSDKLIEKSSSTGKGTSRKWESFDKTSSMARGASSSSSSSTIRRSTSLRKISFVPWKGRNSTSINRSVSKLEGEAEHNQSGPATVSKDEIEFPKPDTNEVSPQKVILVAIGIALCLILLIFFLYYRRGLFSQKSDPE